MDWLDRVVFVTLCLSCAGVWGVFVLLLNKFDSLTELLSVYFLLGMGVWVGFSIGLTIDREAV